MNWIAGSVVVAFGIWLIGLAAFIFVAPDRAKSFLLGFASSARTHYVEQVLRLTVGVAITIFAHQMTFPALFRAFGWVIAFTALGLLLVPWKWHRRFARWVMPPVIQHVRLFALGAFTLGAFILYAAISQ